MCECKQFIDGDVNSVYTQAVKEIHTHEEMDGFLSETGFKAFVFVASEIGVIRNNKYFTSDYVLEKQYKSARKAWLRLHRGLTAARLWVSHGVVQECLSVTPADRGGGKHNDFLMTTVSL